MCEIYVRRDHWCIYFSLPGKGGRMFADSVRLAPRESGANTLDVAVREASFPHSHFSVCRDGYYPPFLVRPARLDRGVVLTLAFLSIELAGPGETAVRPGSRTMIEEPAQYRRPLGRLHVVFPRMLSEECG